MYVYTYDDPNLWLRGITFTVEVIKAWDCAIANMRKGELARITCGPEYAYGERGMPPKIPPNATIIFEVELIDWKGGWISHTSLQLHC